MNKKGQVELGAILSVFIMVLVGLILLVASAQQVGDTTNTVDIVNDSLSSTNGTTLAALPQLNGKFASDVVVFNGSDDLIIDAGNYTVLNNQVINGVETAAINVTASIAGGIQIQAWNISYTSQPTTYISNSGGRAIAGIIIIFFAIAIAIVTLQPTLKNKILDLKS